MTSKSELTPEQQQFDPEIRSQAYRAIPPTCTRLQLILDRAMRSLDEHFNFDSDDRQKVQAILQKVADEIRDGITNPLRTAQMRALHHWFEIAKLLPRNESRKDTQEQHFEDLHSQLALRFMRPRGEIKQRLFAFLFGPTYRKDGRMLDEQCASHLEEQGLIPIDKARKIRFTHDTALLIQLGAAGFGAVEEEFFEKGSELDVLRLTGCEPPATDMVDAQLLYGRKTCIPVDAFEIVADKSEV